MTICHTCRVRAMSLPFLVDLCACRGCDIAFLFGVMSERFWPELKLQRRTL